MRKPRGLRRPGGWAMAKFDAEMLRQLRDAREVAIRTDKHPKTGVVVWVVVADDKVFVRSVYGTRGRWYRDLAESGLATLVVTGRRVPVHAVPEREAPAIAAASEAYLQKYGLSFYAQAMVKPEVLAHT